MPWALVQSLLYRREDWAKLDEGPALAVDTVRLESMCVEDETVQPGTKIDRFGFPKSPKGSFFSPAGKPHTGRAIPPGQAERYVYEVVAPHPLPVKAGEIKPWFDDPGGQTQFELDAELIRETYGPGSGSNVSEAEFAQMLDSDGRVSFLYWFGFKG